MPSGLELLNDEVEGKSISGLNLLDEVVPPTLAPIVKSDPQHKELRNYFENSQPPWMIPNFNNLPLSELGTPAPPGGWDEEGNPLDEKGIAYKSKPKDTRPPGLYTAPRQNFLEKMGNEVKKLFTTQAEEKAKATYSIVMAEQLGVRPSDISPDLYTAFMGGFGNSVTGLIKQVKSGKKFPKINPKAIEAMPDVPRRITQAGQIVGDLPFMAAGAFAGGVAGGGNPITAFASAVAVPEGLRALYSYELDNGELNTPKKFTDALEKSIVATGKGLVTGAATGAVGKIAGPLGVIPRLGAEATTMSTVGAALEGKLPTAQEIGDAAILIVGLHGATNVPKVAKNIKTFWTKTGQMPIDIVTDAQGEPKLAEWLVKGGEIPEDVLKKAQDKVTETAKIQEELALKDAMKFPIDINALIVEELMEKGRRIEEVKKEKSSVTVGETPKSAQNLVDERSNEQKATDLGIKFNGVQKLPNGKEFPIFTDNETGSSFSVKEGESVEVGLGRVRERFKAADKAKETIPMDEEVELTVPKELEEEHPLRDTDVEHTNTMSKIFREKVQKTSSPETYTRYLINEVNRYLNGEEVDIDAVRNGLSELATRVDEVEQGFDNPLYFQQWKKTVSEAARWARNVDRLKIKQTTGTTLNMGVDPTQLAPFFSKMKKLVEEKMGGRMKYSDLLNMLDKQGITQDEMANIFDKPTGKEGMITKQEVLDTIKANEVKLEDVVLSDKYVRQEGGGLAPEVQFESYQLPGGKPGSYREMFVTAPDYLQSVKGQYGNDVTKWPKSISEWQDGHSQYSNIQNPVVRIRFNEREVPVEGEQKLGYKELNLLRDIEQDRVAKANFGTTWNKLSIDEQKSILSIVDKGVQSKRLSKVKRVLFIEEMQGPSDAEQSKMPDYLRKRIYDIGTKRILSYAKEKGYDGVAWTTGEQQAERYDLSKHYKSISYSTTNDGYLLRGERVGEREQFDNFGEVTSDKLEDFVGKEVAKKIKDGEGRDAGPYKYIEGVNLKVGGEGLKSLYDKIIPSMMKKYGKGELSKFEIDRTESEWGDTSKRKMEEVQYVPITEKTPTSFPLYSGVDPVAGTKAIVDAAKRARDYVKHARSMKEFKPGSAYKMAKEELTRSVVDRSGNIRRELLDNLSEEGSRIIQKMYLSKGASARSAELLRQMRKEVYSGLNGEERRVLDTVILMDRMLDIGKYKTAKQFNFPKGASPVEAAAYRELYQYVEKLTPEMAQKIERKAQAYFEWMKKPLKDMLDSGLLSQEEYDRLVSHNYRRIKLVDVYDRRYSAKVGKTKRTIYDSGVEALSHGRDTDIFEPSSEIMALEVFNRAYGRIMNNEANLSLLNLARNHADNPFVRVKEQRGDKIPSGWNRIFVYESGERKALYISPEMSKEWITNSPEISYKLGQVLRYASGSPVLRTFATGINWGFALANMPRDVMHAWYAARTFENGKWKSLYSNFLPQFVGEIGHDISSVALDAILRKGRYQDYINEGGGMEFLVHQGRLLQRGRHVEGGLDKVLDFLGYFGETSEVMTRLAIRERALRRGKSSREATFAARDYMDFAQGGGVVKAVDNALPYLNASVQGTRGLLRAFKDSPIESTWKLAQFGALVTGLYIASHKYSPQTMQSVQGSIDSQNNIIVPLGDQFSYVDERGQTRYLYFKLPLDPGQKFFKAFFEASTDKWLGNEIDVDKLTGSLSALSPVGVSSLPPTLSSVLGYIQNKNYWLNDEIWNSQKYGGPYDFPNSKEEFIPGKTPQAMVDIGKLTGLSPERTKYAIEQLITKDNIFTTLGGGMYEKVFGEVPKVEKEFILADALSKMPGIRRFIGVTNPYSQFAGGIKEVRQEADLERFIQNRGLDARFEGYLADRVSRQEVFEYMQSFKDRDIYNRLKERFQFSEKIKELPNRSFWLSLKGIEDTEARARIYLERLDKASPEEKEQIMKKELPIVLRAGGVISDEFRRKVMELKESE